MKEFLTDLLICPRCLPKENPLACRAESRDRDDVIQGELSCRVCGARYPIRRGIANLLPDNNWDEKKNTSKYESPEVLASYLWAHYGDLTGDEEANSCYEQWASLVSARNGFSLDAGCAVGRFTLEMSRKTDFAVGMDASFRFVETSRQLMKDRRLLFALPMEGHVSEERTIALPAHWPSEKVEFVVGDAQAIPFRGQSFSSVASLNMIDKVPLPLHHLKELNRAAPPENAQLIVSDPFSWSEEICPEKSWLGGARKGPFTGGGMENVKGLLEGKGNEMTPPWSVSRTGHVWWKLRNHRNHFELIRSWFIRAVR